MKNLLLPTDSASAHGSSQTCKGPPPKGGLPPWLVLTSIMLVAGAIVFTARAYVPGCDDCCRPDCSGGRGCGVWIGGIDSAGRLWSMCYAADYPPCFFGGSCQTCPPDECPPGSDGGGGGGGGGGGAYRGPLAALNAGGNVTGTCYSCGAPTGGGGGGGPSGTCGMPVWWVSEPNCTLWFKDTPLRYQPSRGPAVEFTLFSRDNWVGDLGDEAVSGALACFGQHWTSPWLCYVKQQSSGIWTFYTGVGGAIPFHGFSTSDDPAYVAGWLDYRQRFTTYMSNGYRVVQYINGALDVFGYAAVDSLGATRYFLTQRIDPQGNQLLFSYSQSAGVTYLNSITDPDGHQVTFNFSTVNGLPLITGVADSYGHSVSLGYDAQAYLTSITDAAGLTSSFEYYTFSGAEVPSKLITPYGTNVFYNFNGAAVLVDEKGLGHHLYIYQASDGLGRVPTSYAAWVPSTTGSTFSFPNSFDTESMDQRNSYYWNPRQYELLPASFRSAIETGTYDSTLLTATSFLLGRQRHWLVEAGVGRPLSLERAPSPDGTVQGQITWYDYAGRTDPTQIGSMIQPSFIAWQLPNGQSRFSYYVRNEVGHATNVIETYTGSAGDVRVRTNAIVYAANNLDVVSLTNAAGVRVAYNVYNASHQVTASYDALGELTSYTYDTYGRLTSVTRPSGLVTTNIYGPDGYLSETRDIGIRTNSYTWANGLVQTHTDELGLSVTQSWEGLNRLIKTVYPDATYITNIYQNLDPVQVIDRMGFTNRFEYNRLRQQTASIDALNRTNLYGYCNCGQLTSSTDPLSQTTTWSYDYAGGLIQTLYPDNYSVTYNRDLMGQVTNVVDSGGYNVTNWYNNQGLPVASSNAFGQVSATVYDILDQLTSTTDANGVTLANTYDALGRLVARGYPDGGVEQFGYSARGLTAHTNQLGFTNLYVYDAAGRKTFETNANGEVLRFTNNAAGALLSLTDGKTNTTRWVYDLYGRVTNKFDAAGTLILRYQYDPDARLTNRWSAAKGNTQYRYDPVGNLTNVVYPSSPSVVLQYDPLNRLTNMVDASGTTKYTYTVGNQVLTEDGPFASDTVTNTYANRLRINLALQQASGVWTNAFAYDAARRLTDVVSPAGTFLYGYPASSATLHPSRLTLPNAAYITNAYDVVARLTGTYLRTNAGGLANKHEYQYNPAGQWTNQTRIDGITVAYTYDNIGQLRTVYANSTAADMWSYGYDAAWNLSRRTNGNNGVFWTAFPVNNLNELLYTTYDANGNLTSYSAYNNSTYSYDDENRIVQIADNVNYSFMTQFTYDGKGRLRIRDEYLSQPDPYYPDQYDWYLASETRYVYDGWRVIQERDGNNSPAVAYTRGTDLSGSLEGAGGIGGLLARSDLGAGTHAYYHADGSGNIAMMLDGSQTMVASYRYNDPYGNNVTANGTLAGANLYRFSSKEFHVNSGLYYYGYRFYFPNPQRWVNRDPMEERGFGLTLKILGSTGESPSSGPFVNAYYFARNNPFTFLDPDGGQIWRFIPKSETTIAGPALRRCYFLGESTIVGGGPKSPKRMCAYLCDAPRGSDETIGLGKLVPEQTFPKGKCPCTPPSSGSKAHPTQIIPGPPPPSPYE